jgi:tRNA (guanine37-N1)-methyltransferase
VKIAVVSLFPEVFEVFLKVSIIGRAVREGLVDVKVIQLRDFACNKHKKCDDYPFGGGPGMVLKPEPVIKALEQMGTAGKRVIFTTPAGARYDQAYAQQLKEAQDLIILCGHYEGMDQRIIDRFVTDEISVGDYVLSGGESAAMVIIDSLVRLVAGVINPESLQSESFRDGLLEYPHYTRPRNILGMDVPEILLNGNHEEIRRWRLHRSIEKTLVKRPDLFERIEENEEIKDILRESEVENNGFVKGN